MTKMWILVANSSEARLYESYKPKLFNGSAEMTLVSEFSHPDSRQKNSELVSDRFGEYQHSPGSNNSYSPQTDPHAMEGDKFAKNLVEELSKGHYQNKFDELMVAAPLPFHGHLNSHIKNKLNHIAKIDIERDFTNLNTRDLVKKLQEYL